MIRPGLNPYSASGNLRPVLVVDDDDDLRDSLVEYIRSEGLETEGADSGFQALDKLQRGLRPCIILLDLRMEGMSGWEFRAEQKKDPHLSGIPVVAMTGGYSKWRDADDFTACLRKPLDPVSLSRQLKQLCLKDPPLDSDDEHSA
jgi:CheY-like chemotaxis protein